MEDIIKRTATFVQECYSHYWVLSQGLLVLSFASILMVLKDEKMGALMKEFMSLYYDDFASEIA